MFEQEEELFNTFVNNFIPVFIMIFSIVIGLKILKFIWFKLKVIKYQKKLAQSGIKDIDQMDGLQFETYLKALFKELGYKSQVTTGSHDFGADLIMKQNNKKIVVQAKRYKYKSNVSIDAVQQIFTAKEYYMADQAWVITNSFYTKSANELAKSCRVKLLDRFELVDFINKINPGTKPEAIKKTIEPENRKCPSCNGTLTARNSKQGNSFMGCSNYPTCKHTENIAK